MDAYDEMDEVQRVIPHIQKIPNAHLYFLDGDIKLCDKPAPLSSSDKRHFDSTCGNFNTLNSSNVNSSLGNISFITMPYGGPDLKEFWSNKWNTMSEFIDTNQSQVDLLVNAIAKLNANDFYHLDIKGHNILRNEENGRVLCRLIDWGLSGEHKTANSFMSRFGRCVPQFNLPPSILLLRSDVRKWLETKLKNDAVEKKFHVGTHLPMRAIAQKIYMDYGVGVGHDRYMDGMFKDIFGLYSDNFIKGIHVNYMASVLAAFVDEKGTFHVNEYVMKVFRKNVDIYGFLTSYVPLVRNSRSRPFRNELTRILSKYCFGMEFAATPIDVAVLKNKLLALNTLVKRDGFANTKPKAKSKTDIMNQPCPSGKMRNPDTGRCIKKKKSVASLMKEPCPPGKEHNPKTGNCVKRKTKKSVASLMKEPCPPGKEHNPKTGNCVKRKTKKSVASLMKVPCPPGKEHNPKTGRCVKIKTKKKTKTPVQQWSSPGLTKRIAKALELHKNAISKRATARIAADKKTNNKALTRKAPATKAMTTKALTMLPRSNEPW